MTWLAIAAGVLLLVGAVAISHSRFSADLAVIDRAWADVTADLRRRYDLVPRFVETVRGQIPDLGRELDDVVVARTRAIQMSRQAPGRVAVRAEAENELTTALARVMEAVRDEVASMPAVVAPGDDIGAVQARIAADAHLYNLAVQGHNRRVAAAPTRLVAALFAIERRPYLTMVDPSPGSPIS